MPRAVFAAPPEGYHLAWNDEFNASALDTNKWNHWLAGKRRDAFNVPEAVSLDGSNLVITTYTAGGTNFTGMIATHKTFLARHGYLEARIQFHDAPGTWSAFWLQTPTMNRPHGNPAAAGAEIDICEHRFQDEHTNINDQVQVNIHWDGYGRSSQSKGSELFGADLGHGFHTYGFLWTTNDYQFFVDGKLFYQTAAGLSHQEEFFILSSEVDDTSTKWAGRIPRDGYGDLPASQTKMTVDYVRYFAPAISASGK